MEFNMKKKILATIISSTLFVSYGLYSVSALAKTDPVQNSANSEQLKSEQIQAVRHHNRYDILAKAIVARMSDEEKLKMLVGAGMDPDQDQIVNLKASVNGVAGYIHGVYDHKRHLDVPALKLADGPAGIRIDPTRDGDDQTYYATAFPNGALMASTWNPDLIHDVGEAVANEGKEYGVDFWLAPGMNIQRNPLNGRNFEYYSEDPLVSGMIASAMVQGAQSKGLATTIKHFVANNSETNRFFIDAVVTPRALREIYLRGFEYAVKESHPWGIMSSYNQVNGVNSGERSDLMTDILRHEWGFNGLAMSDWFAGYNPIDLLNAGVDVIQPGGKNVVVPGLGDWSEYVVEGYKKGDLTQATLDRNVQHIVAQALKTPSAKHYPIANNPDLQAHATLAKRVADEGIILLKNQNSVLPLATSQAIASFGITQINTLKGGTGSGDVHPDHVTTIIDGLAKQFPVNQGLASFYNDYFEANKVITSGSLGVSKIVSCTEPSVTDLGSQISGAAQHSDVAVITLGRVAGEAADRKAERGDYLLSETELGLISSVSHAFHAQNKKVVVVLNIAGVIDMSEWQDQVDGIVLAYMPGQESGDAIADIISGKSNPSGKLAQTIPLAYADVPSSATFPGVDENNDGTLDHQYYNEDIYVGYRYYQTFDKAVAYPFGYGLSYTSFNLSRTRVLINGLNHRHPRKGILLKTVVANTGDVAGKEVVQVYVAAPEVKLKKPNIELKAFAKTRVLAPGRSQRMVLEISPETLASFDPKKNQWIVEPGTYQVYVSQSSDITSVAPVQFDVRREIVVENTTPGALALEEGVTAASFVTVAE
ncbi:Exo-alpha-(1-_6)-L-arabinopyranosidase [Vibrio spartinae]|uniref:Exo-alpha-(1->6)-L-arabinopyranosidase n=2 Tax=Vibrio spartinae TaxID=1918945 RepID=A0A1N6LZN5_9VIBR|nr:Exo-alpha-(1->6)-L-arabinopyranosidase [Vibrio spartinae]SIO92649.1 Exo-alpha-(1->6)-L-arabinopyranosidase [Vibrio spartinae]